MLQTVWNGLDNCVDVCRIIKGAPVRYVTKTWSVVLLNKKIHILLSEVYCVWQVVKTPTVILSNSVYIKVKFSRYRPGVAQRVCRGIALLFHDRGTRRG